MGDANQRAAVGVQDKSLLGLSVAITGKAIDMDTIQILDPEPFGKIMNWMVQGMNESLKNNSLSLDICTVLGWEQDDGSLIVRLMHKSAVNDEFRISPEKWRPATPEALKQAGLNLDSPEGAVLMKELADSALAIHERAKKSDLRPSATDLAEMLDSVFMVIGHTPAGLHLLNSIASHNPNLITAADRWIESGAKYFTAFLERNGNINAAEVRTARADDELMGILARHAASNPDIAKTGLNICGAAPEIERAAYALWSAHNGNMALTR